MSKTAVSIILPCYNEGQTFEKSVRQIIKVLNSLKKPWEIIFVEDKSTDKTKKTIEKLVDQIKNFQAIYHPQNQGRGKSVADGIKAAKGKICGYLDVDLEVSEKYIPLFVKEIENGNDLVAGHRFYEGGLKSLSRYLSSKIYSFIVMSLFRIPIRDTEAGYKFFRRSKIIPILSKVQNKHWFWDTEICARAYLAGLKISEIPILFVRRYDKKSTVKLIPDTIDYIRNLIRLKSQISNSKTQTIPKS